MRKLNFALLSLFLVLCVQQNVVVGQDCAPPTIVANSKNYNIFSPEQEMILGDLTNQSMAGDMRLLRDEQLLAYLRKIGDKLTQHIPPTGLKFKFYIIDLPEANAFNIPGGYVFVSRKLIAFTKTEDELAGVMAHELGHATVHHAANDLSNALKRVLNVTSVTDQKDITEKYNLLLERARTKKVSNNEGHESEQQLEADRIGVFAMVAAGYNPDAFSSFFSRLTEEKAKSGNWFSDLFGKSTPNEKRLKDMVKVAEQLPPACRPASQAAPTDEYLKWQADVVSYVDRRANEELPGLMWKKALDPQLRSDISHFAISTDGKYFLAQDDFAITVVQRDPIKILFQIPVDDAQPASFTPDNEYVVFGTQSLRFEKWKIAEAKPVEIRELVVRRDCWEHEFSPDGKFLACIDFGLNMNILETQTGKKVWEKKQFSTLNALELISWISAEISGVSKSASFFNLEFSPDSHYLVATRSSKFRFRFSIDSMTVDKTEDSIIALDLTTLKPVSIGGDLSRATRRPFLFVGPNKILGSMQSSVNDGGIFSFPDGKRLAKFAMSAEELKRTGNEKYIVVKPLLNAKLGVFDIEKSAIVSGANKEDVTLWNDMMVFESSNGKVVVAKVEYDAAKNAFNTTPIDTIDIPVASMKQLQNANVSGNMEWLTMSSKTRGGVWNLKTGERKVFVRGFRGSIVADNGTSLADFPTLGPMAHSLVYLDANTNTITPVREVAERGVRLHGRFLLSRTSLKPKKEEKKDDSKKKDDKDPPPPVATVDSPTAESLRREVKFELHDVVQDKVVWSQEFRKEAPSYYFDEYSGRLIFYWSFDSDEAKAKLKEDPALAERAKRMGNKDDDYLLEIVDAFQQKTVGTLLVETGNGSFDIDDGFSDRDWLVVHDSSHNRILAYSIKTGELVHRFFGANASISPAREQLIVENYPGELALYDLNSGTTSAKLVFNSPLAFARFSLDGKSLFVLTSKQTAYAFDTAKIASAAK